MEDDENVAAMVLRVLEDAGLECVRTSHAREALEQLERENFSAMLSDVVMPGGMNGVELARHVRERWPRLPIVLATGYAGKTDIQPEEFTVLQKPFDADVMLAALDDAMAGG